MMSVFLGVCYILFLGFGSLQNFFLVECGRSASFFAWVFWSLKLAREAASQKFIIQTTPES